MLFEATVNGTPHTVELRRRGEGWTLHIDARPLEFEVLVQEEHFLTLLVAGRRYELGLEPSADGCRVSFAEGALEVALRDGRRPVGGGERRGGGPARVTAPMPGRVVRVLVAPGDSVRVGQGLVVVEAMKMENELRAAREGRVEQVAVREGQAIEAGALLVVLA